MVSTTDPSRLFPLGFLDGPTTFPSSSSSRILKKMSGPWIHTPVLLRKSGSAGIESEIYRFLARNSDH
jgi:hypothetical protein